MHDRTTESSGSTTGASAPIRSEFPRKSLFRNILDTNFLVLNILHGVGYIKNLQLLPLEYFAPIDMKKRHTDIRTLPVRAERG
jgi:hypothetical protein